MIKLIIDNNTLSVEEGTTILQAAKSLGIEIPTMCHLEGYKPQTTCMICVAQELNSGKFLPSCSALAQNGMVIETLNDRIRDFRKTTLELLFSEHVGECVAPCQLACPADLNVPLMMEQIASRSFEQAIKTVKTDISLPGVLGYICSAPCENACRKSKITDSAAICMLKRTVALDDLEKTDHFKPECKPDSGKSVAIIGAGAAGLSCAYYLRQQGHSCTLFDDQERPGGSLWVHAVQGDLPEKILENEIQLILELGVEFQGGKNISERSELESIEKIYDAVALCVGRKAEAMAKTLELELSGDIIKINNDTFETGRDKWFAGGSCVRRRKTAVQSVSDGKLMAFAINGYLNAEELAPAPRVRSKLGKLDIVELQEFMKDVNPLQISACRTPSGGLNPDEAEEQGHACMQCGCKTADICKLRKYADEYGADINRYSRGGNGQFTRRTDHPYVVFEPGKCINCGLCVEITQSENETLGLSFIGRGFDITIDVPFNETLERGIEQTALKCTSACPTGAIAMKKRQEEIQ